MRKPIIGLTSHAVAGPILSPAIGPIVRSAIGRQYVEAVVAAGGTPIGIPLGLDEDGRETIYELLDGLLLPGGDDVGPERYGHPRHDRLGAVDDERDDLEIWFAQRALRDDLPVLGICRGIQLLAVAAGGTLYQDLPSQLTEGLPHDVRDYGRDYLCHAITLEDSSQLASLLGCSTVEVNSFHHQAVQDVPEGFVVAARSADGVIEAIESTSHRFAVGLQCHPEGMWRTTGPLFAHLFTAFVEAARNHVAAA